MKLTRKILSLVLCLLIAASPLGALAEELAENAAVEIAESAAEIPAEEPDAEEAPAEESAPAEEIPAEEAAQEESAPAEEPAAKDEPAAEETPAEEAAQEESVPTEEPAAEDEPAAEEIPAEDAPAPTPAPENGEEEEEIILIQNTHQPVAEITPEPTPESEGVGTADKIPEFKRGYAILIHETMGYESAAPDAEVQYYLQRGVLYATARRNAESCDRLKVHFNGGGEEKTAWVDSSALQPMTEADIAAFFQSAAGVKNLLYLEDDSSVLLHTVSYSGAFTFDLSDLPQAKVPAMLVAQESLTLGVKETAALSVSFSDGETYRVKFKSDNKKIATVDETGLVTAKKRGSTVIRVTSEFGNETAVTVTVKKAPEFVRFPVEKGTLGAGEEVTLKTKLSSGSASALRFSSSDKSIATVDASGKLTALKAGKATITVKTYNNRKDTIKLTVKKAPKTIAISTGDEITMGVGQKIALKAQLSEGSAGAYTFALTEGSEEFLSIDTETNTLKAVKAGSGVVFVESYNGLRAETAVTVKKAPTGVSLAKESITIGVGEKVQMPQISLGEGCGGGYTLKTSNKRYVTVSESGVIKGARAGSAKITVKTYNGKSATLKVTVKKAPSKLTLSHEKLNLGVGEEMTLKVKLSEKSGGSVKFESSKPEVVSVTSAGKIKAEKKGSAVITATSFNGKTDSCTVTVLPAPKSVSFSRSKLTLGKGESYTLSASVNEGSAGSIRFESGNEDIAVIDKTGKLTAKAAGTATLYARSYNGKSAECTLTVKKAPSAIRLQEGSITLSAGDTYKIPAPSVSEGAACSAYTYKSSNKKYASVNAAGVVSAKKKGSAKITVTSYNGKKATLKVTVKAAPKSISFAESSATVYIGDTYTPQLSFSNSIAGSYTLSSSDEKIVDVEGYSLRALKKGTATITATSFNGKKASMKITVPALPDEIQLKHRKRIIGVGESVVLPAVMPSGQGCALTYTSSDESVATVENSGRVTAKKAGTSVITVHTVNGLTSQCQLTVKKAPTAIKVSPANAKRSIGEGSMTLSISFASDAEYGSCTYTSSDESIATVSSGKVSFKSVGTVQITATTYNGLCAVCNLTIGEQPTSLEFTGSTYSIAVGDSRVLPVRFDQGGESYTLTPADKSILRAEGDTVYALKKGATTLTVTSRSGLTDSCTVKVVSAPTGVEMNPASAEMQMGVAGANTLQLKAKALPGGIGSLRYTSSDPSIAEVDYYTGLVTAKKKGRCTITAATYDGGASADCKITVNALLDGVRIGIDPGHQAKQNLEKESSSPKGGKSKAKVSSGTRGVSTKIKEYQTNLTVGLKLRDALESLGAEVYMTRESNDVNISNKERALMMNKLDVDLVLRLHCNSAGSGSVKGVDIYIRKTCAYPSSVVNGSQLLSNENRLAKAVFDEYTAATGLKKRGVRKNNEYTGNNWSTVPCLLLEMGFSSNSTEDKKLNNPEFQEKMVQGMINGICKYMGRDLAFQN